MAQIAESLTNLSASIAGDRQKRSNLGVALRAEVKRRHTDVRAFLKGLGTSRARAGVESRRQAAASSSQRRKAVGTLLTKLTTDRKARAVKQRTDAATFMRNLSSSVSATLDRLDREGKERARHIRQELSGFRFDRRSAETGWSEKPKAKAAAAPPASSANATVAHTTHSAPEPVAPAHTPAPHQGGHASNRSSSERHGRDSK